MGVRATSMTAPTEDCFASIFDRQPGHPVQVGTATTAPSGFFEATTNILGKLASDHEPTSLVDLLTKYQDLFDVDSGPFLGDVRYIIASTLAAHTQ